MIWAANRNCAFNINNSTARPSMLATSDRALYIGFRKATTPTAVTTSQAATMANPTTTCAAPLGRRGHRTARPCHSGLRRAQVVVGFAIVAAWELVTAVGVVAFRKPM